MLVEQTSELRDLTGCFKTLLQKQTLRIETMGEHAQASLFEPIKDLWKVIAGSTLIASMCCLPSVVLVMLGLATVSTGAALSDTLYWGENGYSWFRPLMGLIALGSVVIGLTMYFRNQGICTLDHAKRERRKIINISITVLCIAFACYWVFNYVILTELGIQFGLPWESSRDSYMFWR
tara:strand:- start:214 stop:747 length:534 start_codon:yes stop_codon:yes gene_type:complete